MLIVVLSFVLYGCGPSAVKVSNAGTGMGTIVQTTLYVYDEDTGNTVWTDINDCLSAEEEWMSWRLEDSEIARINAAAGTEKGYEVQEELAVLLGEILEVSEKSDGALDVTIGSITQMWNLDSWAKGREEDFQVPVKEEIEKQLSFTGYDKVKIEKDTVYLPAYMQLDLGAVGKGIVCDSIGDYLRTQEGVTGAVITVGGSVVTYGSRPDGRNWMVAIAHPREEGAYLGALSLQGEQYVATSGDYERYVEKAGERYHHILDPATGYPADSGLCSVTIVSDSGLLSDALSTACFVLGKEKGLALVEEFDAEALFVTNHQELVMTEGMESIFVPED